MKDSKLVRLLKTLSKAEWKEFEKFAASPYFNRGRNYIPYIKELKKFYPRFDSVKLAREHIYSALYPGKKCNDSVMFTVTSGLYSLAEEFLIQKEVESNQFNKDLHLLSQLSVRNVDGIHNRFFQSIEKRLQSQKAGKDFFALLAELQTHKVQHSMKGNYEKSLAENVPARGDYHIFNFIVVLLNEVRDQVVLKDNYNITSGKDLSGRIYRAIDLEKLTEYTDEHYPQLAPVMKTIVKCYAASLSTGSIYFEAKELIMQHYNLFNNNLLRELILIMEGGAAMRLNSGNREFIREWHELHRFSVDKRIHIYETNKYIHPLTAHNMLNMAFWNKEYGWIEYFINEHQTDFPGEFRDYLVNIGSVYLHISRREFNKALKLLTTIDEKLFSFKKRVRSLLLITYYELGDYELALNGLDSIKHFIDNNKDKYTELSKDSSLIFISFYEKLLKHKFDGTELNLRLLRERIMREKPSQSLDWLIEKIEAIEETISANK